MASRRGVAAAVVAGAAAGGGGGGAPPGRRRRLGGGVPRAGGGPGTGGGGGEDPWARGPPPPGGPGEPMTAVEAQVDGANGEPTRRRRRRRGGRGRGRGRRADAQEEPTAVASDGSGDGEGADIGWQEFDDLSQLGLSDLGEPGGEREYAFEEADPQTLAELGLEPETSFDSTASEAAQAESQPQSAAPRSRRSP